MNNGQVNRFEPFSITPLPQPWRPWPLAATTLPQQLPLLSPFSTARAPTLHLIKLPKMSSTTPILSIRNAISHGVADSCFVPAPAASSSSAAATAPEPFPLLVAVGDGVLSIHRSSTEIGVASATPVCLARAAVQGVSACAGLGANVVLGSIGGSLLCTAITSDSTGALVLEEVWSSDAHALAVNKVALQASGESVASVGDDGAVVFADVASGKVARAIRGAEQTPLLSCAWLDGGLLCTGSGNGGCQVKVWDPRASGTRPSLSFCFARDDSGSEVGTGSGSRGDGGGTRTGRALTVSAVAAHPTRAGVLAVGTEAGLTLFDSQLRPLSSQAIGEGSAGGITALAFNADDPRYLYCACPSPAVVPPPSALAAAALPLGAQAPAATVLRLDYMRSDGIISWDSPASLCSVVFEDITGMGVSSLSFARGSGEGERGCLLYGCESGELVLQQA